MPELLNVVSKNGRILQIHSETYLPVKAQKQAFVVRAFGITKHKKNVFMFLTPAMLQLFRIFFRSGGLWYF